MNTANDAAADGNLPLGLGFKELLILASIYLYFAGWTYIYFLFENFGISLHAVEIPFYYFFAYSYSVVEPHWVLTLTAVLSLLLLLYLFSSAWSKYLAVGLLVAFLPATFCIARQTALEQAHDIRSRAGAPYPEVRFVLKGANRAMHSDQRSMISFDTLNDDWSLKLLTHTGKYFYAIYVPRKLPDVKALPMAQVFIIPSDSVERVETRIDTPVQ